MQQYMKEVGDFLMELKWNTEREYSRFQVVHLIQLVHKLMKALGIKTKCKDMESISMLREQFIKENGKIINIMAKVYMNSQMEQFIKANGKIN